MNNAEATIDWDMTIMHTYNGLPNSTLDRTSWHSPLRVLYERIVMFYDFQKFKSPPSVSENHQTFLGSKVNLLITTCSNSKGESLST